MKRLFIAIKILPDQQFLNVYYQLLKQFENEPIKWVEPHNMHITLKFFGETEKVKIPEIIQATQLTALGFQASQIDIIKMGLFGSKYRPRVIWLGIKQEQLIINVARDLHKRLEPIGFKTDRQNFVPHLTIGRIKKELVNKLMFQKTIDSFKDAFIQHAEINEIVLFESILKQTGPIYKKLERFELI